ncbi:MAG: hypothetical protein K8U57_14165 [Planctomycetes bacterium]|nr:hypothetical protein [Planctomycetota bacterium]
MSGFGQLVDGVGQLAGFRVS